MSMIGSFGPAPSSAAASAAAASSGGSQSGAVWSQYQHQQPSSASRSVTLVPPSALLQLAESQQQQQQFSLQDPDPDSPNWVFADGPPPQLLVSLYEQIASSSGGSIQLEWQRPQQQVLYHGSDSAVPAQQHQQRPFVGQTILISHHQQQQQQPQHQHQFFSQQGPPQGSLP